MNYESKGDVFLLVRSSQVPQNASISFPLSPMKHAPFVTFTVVASLLLTSCRFMVPEQSVPVTAPDADVQEEVQEDIHAGESAEQIRAEEQMNADAAIDTYEKCIAAGYAMMKSMPPQCATANGRVFVEGGGTMEERMMNPDRVLDEPPVDHGGWVDEQGKPGTYSSYVDGVIGNGMESVLFFHAAWCPYCIANDMRLQNWYGSDAFPRSTYKIDYDTADELKKLFNVTNQDTFILIDGNGNELKRVTFPSESALRELLG